MKNTNQKKQSGFTLIELLMAVLIIAILATVGITQFNNFSSDAKNSATKANLAILRNAIGTMNALERIRCGKVNLLFPAVGTLQSNDISGCTPAPAPHAGVIHALASCYYANLNDPKTGLPYTDGCLSDPVTDGHYNSLIPMVDRPFVQNTIPNNPWQSADETTLLANTITADTPNAILGAPCFNSPIYSSATIGKACTTLGTPYGTAAKDGGWCYCVATGQIWANTGNNDGVIPAGTGVESLF